MSTTLLIHATNPQGFRHGHTHPRGIVADVVVARERPAFRIEFSGGEVDIWLIYNTSDCYEFKILTL